VGEKLGFIPYPGTLDVKITEESFKLKQTLATANGKRIMPAEGFCNGKAFKAAFKTEPRCGVILPEVPGYPEDLIEVIARQNLRKKFHLSDGDTVQVKVTL